MEIKIDFDGWTNSHSFYSISEPGLIILLLDQTQFEIEQKDKLSELSSIAKAVNKFIYNLILSNVNYDKVKDRCFLKLISYADRKFELKEGWLTTFADNPISVEKDEPIWVEEMNKGQNPSDISFVEKHIKEWHLEKGTEYPKSIIVHFYRRRNKEIAESIRTFVSSNLAYKKPKLIEINLE